MSASNWAYCPKCYKEQMTEFNAKIESLRCDMEASYGTSLSSEYIIKYIGYNDAKAKKPEIDHTLRVDYEIGINKDGDFCVQYKAQCKCGFYYEYYDGWSAEDQGWSAEESNEA